MTPLVLSLFPGIGLLDMAFEAEGFCVVRGPDLLWGGDVRRFHPPAGRFEGVIGGPPCQAFSRLRHIVEHNGYETAPNMIPEYERCVREAAPGWFLMENVPAAPEPDVPGYGVRSAVLDNRDFGGVQQRTRRFSFGTADGRRLDRHLAELAMEAPVSGAWAPAVTRDVRAVPVAVGGSGKRKRSLHDGREMPNRGRRLALSDMLERQGFPRDLLDDCPLTMKGKRSAVGNGVPLPMGRAVAKAVRRAMYETEHFYGR